MQRERAQNSPGASLYGTIRVNYKQNKHKQELKIHIYHLNNNNKKPVIKLFTV